jgi:hypothetical protein
MSGDRAARLRELAGAIASDTSMPLWWIEREIAALEAMLADREAERGRVTPDFYWGACPECGNEGIHLSIERTNVVACHEHRVCWVLGYNLFSGWLHETEEVWRENARLLSAYAKVEPVYFRHEVKDQAARARQAALEPEPPDFGPPDFDLGAPDDELLEAMTGARPSNG